MATLRRCLSFWRGMNEEAIMLSVWGIGDQTETPAQVSADLEATRSAA